jgi:anti-sigma regulatory factor (Ser/Thr protein kinase)
MKIPAEIVRRVSIVTYEAEMNICSYAKDGKIVLTVTPEEITIDAIDKGQGIPDIEMAMKEGYSTATEEIWSMGFGAGMGLSNIKHFSDIFYITSEVGKGTRLTMKIHTVKTRKSAPH